jgi:hypothetical protein
MATIVPHLGSLSAGITGCLPFCSVAAAEQQCCCMRSYRAEGRQDIKSLAGGISSQWQRGIVYATAHTYDATECASSTLAFASG